VTQPESPRNPIWALLKKKLTSLCENSGVFLSFGMFVGCFHICKPPSFAWCALFHTKVSPQKFDLTPRGVYSHGTAPPWGDFLCDDDQSTTLQQVGSRRPIRPPRNRITTGKAVLIPQMDARAGAPARAAHGVMPNLRSVPSGRRELSKRNELCKLFARRNLFGARRNPRVG
jgi:hypothetical protein